MSALSRSIPRPANAAICMASATLGVLAVAIILTPSSASSADVPAAAAADGKSEIMKLHAEGLQIYECKAEAGKAANWQFREPLAILTKDGKTVGRHYAGPSWELAAGGAIVGKVDGQATGGSPGDIKLLRLNVIDRLGEGELAKASMIQRLETRGGAFAGACQTPGALHLEPYSAEYVFLGE